MAAPLFSIDPLEPSPGDVPADSRRFRRAAWITLAGVLLLWWIKCVELIFGRGLGALGLVPREPAGLLGIFTAPLLHGSIEHLLANSFPLLVLGTLALYAYPKAFVRALPLIWIGSGIGTWLIGRDNAHIGASGVAHGLMFFLFLLGVLRRDRRAIALSMVTFLLYGSMLLTVLPREAGVSWEYHLTGAFFGAIAALWWRKLDPLPPRKKYSWELEEELAAQQALIDDEVDLPRPHDVPVLWVRPPPDEPGRVIPFRRPGRDAPGEAYPGSIDEDPPTHTRH